MSITTHLKEPLACTEKERRAFADLVRQGFEGSDANLPNRIRDAKCLAFHYAGGDILAAIAGLKVPDELYRDDVFRKAKAPVDYAAYPLELGWIFVVPAYRGSRIGERLCRQLLERAPEASVFATTRPDNSVMIRVLLALGFARAGNPFSHVRRDEELLLFLRPVRPVAGR